MNHWCTLQRQSGSALRSEEGELMHRYISSKPAELWGSHCLWKKGMQLCINPKSRFLKCCQRDAVYISCIINTLHQNTTLKQIIWNDQSQLYTSCLTLCENLNALLKGKHSWKEGISPTFHVRVQQSCSNLPYLKNTKHVRLTDVMYINLRYYHELVWLQQIIKLQAVSQIRGCVLRTQMQSSKPQKQRLHQTNLPGQWYTWIYCAVMKKGKKAEFGKSLQTELFVVQQIGWCHLCCDLAVNKIQVLFLELYSFYLIQLKQIVQAYVQVQYTFWADHCTAINNSKIKPYIKNLNNECHVKRKFQNSIIKPEFWLWS